MGQGSAADIWTGYNLDAIASIFGRVKTFFVMHSVQTDSAIPLSSTPPPLGT
jgi:hypothetical protein